MKTSVAYLVVAIFGFGASVFAQDLRTATLVGTVTDTSGSIIAGAAVNFTNIDTKVTTPGKTNESGAYYVPFLIPGNYQLTVESPGFKQYVQTGLVLNAGETPRIDVKLEIGAITDRIEVNAATPVLDTDSVVVGSLMTAKAINETPIPQSKPQHLLYYMEGAQASNDGSYHILGQPEAQLSYTLDGVNAKRALRTALGDTNTLITPPVDSIQEAQVWTTGIPAEIGHSAGGAYNLTTKSGTNSLHFSAEERYINKAWLHRQVFNQAATNTPFEYHNFGATLSGPIFIPKVYDGKNKTFFFLGYRLDYDHETNYATVAVPDQAELNGNFSFNGLGLPIYDPKTITCANAAGCANGTGYTAAPFTGNVIPQSRIDPVIAKFLSLKPYNLPNLPGTYTNTGPNSNFISGNHYISDRQGYLGKIDQTINEKQKMFVRYIWNKYRVIGSRNNILFNWEDIDNTALGFGLPEPIDERNLAFGHVYTLSPTLINELRFGYQRRNDPVYAVTANQNWAAVLGIPGVGPQTFPGLVNNGGAGSSFNWTANPGGSSRTLNEDFTLADNMTKVIGVHTIKFGYQGILTRENDIAATQPSGVYNFSVAGSALPFTPNTGNSFASLLLGAVDSASFTTLLANYLPRWYTHQFYVQDDWRVRRDLTVSFGLRYSYETPVSTQHGYQSEFNPTAIDPLTGMMGAITHPTGSIYGADMKNFAPRLGMSWNFLPKFVFRGSFGMFTQDVLPQVGQEEYVAQAVVQKVSGSPLPAFYLSQGPGPIQYATVAGSNTANFVGTNYSQRNATYLDPNLRNPYTMTWSGGLQYEFRPNSIAEIVYQGSAGVRLTGTTNINVLPQSIYNSTDTTLLNAVFANTQAYVRFPQFGAVNETSNFGHSTYHAMVTRIERRFNSGISYNVLFTWSKNLAGGAGGDPNLDGGGSFSGASQFYNWALTKAVTSNDQRLQYTSQLTYELPFGKGRRFVNRSGVLDTVIGGWQFLTIQSIRSGLPVQFKLAGSPNKYLPGQGNVPNVVPGQSINVPDYSIGPNVFPQAAQNPFYNINAFANPPAFTQGNAGYGIGRTGPVWWPQYSLSKTWTYREKYRLTAKMEANNLFPQTRLAEYGEFYSQFLQPAVVRQVPRHHGICVQQLLWAEWDATGRVAHRFLSFSPNRR